MIQLLNEQITKEQQAIRALDLRADLFRQEYDQMSMSIIYNNNTYILLKDFYTIVRGEQRRAFEFY